MRPKTPQGELFKYDELQRKVGLELNCCKIGNIIKYNQTDGTVDIQLKDKIELENGKVISRSQLINCPFFVLQGANSGVIMPSPVGCDCIVLFNDRDIDNWWINGSENTPATNRLHALSDGIALIGIYSKGKLPQESNLNLFNGNSSIDISETIIKEKSSLGGEIEISNLIAIKNSTQSLFTLLNTLLTTLLSLKTGIDPNTATFVIDTTTANTLTTLQTNLAQLLKA